MRRAAASLLVCVACGGELEPSNFPGLVAVSGAVPWSGACGGPTAGGTVFRNAVVEPSVAADPADPQHLIGVWQQDRWSNGGAIGLLAAVTFDGGHNWSPSNAPFTRCTGGTFDRGSDPWVSIGAGGTAYQIGYGFDARAAANRAMLVSRSADGGRTWESPIALQHDTDPDLVMDKETLTADPLDGRYAYAVWDRLTGATNPTNPQNTGPTWFARTADGGRTWEPARVIYDPGADAQTIANQIVVLPDATLVNLMTVITKNSSPSPDYALAVIRSADRGLTWSSPAPVVADDQFVGAVDPKSGRGIRSGSVVAGIAADHGSGAIYVVWEDGRFSGKAHDGIALSRSVDGGATWSAPRQVNAQAPGAQAFTPAVAVADGGRVGVTFYDLRNDNLADASRLTVTQWLAVSGDGGATFAETLVGAPFDLKAAPIVDGPAYFLGDYQGLAHAGAGLLPFFVAVPDGGNATAYFRPADAVGLAPNPLELAVLGVQQIWRGARERWRFDTLFK